jgi:hypothetical protein
MSFATCEGAGCAGGNIIIAISKSLQSAFLMCGARQISIACCLLIVSELFGISELLAGGNCNFSHLSILSQSIFPQALHIAEIAACLLINSIAYLPLFKNHPPHINPHFILCSTCERFGVGLILVLNILNLLQ